MFKIETQGTGNNYFNFLIKQVHYNIYTIKNKTLQNKEIQIKIA